MLFPAHPSGYDSTANREQGIDEQESVFAKCLAVPFQGQAPYYKPEMRQQHLHCRNRYINTGRNYRAPACWESGETRSANRSANDHPALSLHCNFFCWVSGCRGSLSAKGHVEKHDGVATPCVCQR